MESPRHFFRIGGLALSVGIIVAGLFGCNSKNSTTLNHVRVALKNDDEARAVRLLDEAKRYPDDLVDAVRQTLQLSPSNWSTQLKTILDEARKADAVVRTLEERARTEDLDDRSIQRMRMLSAERDLAFERLAAWLVKQDRAALVSEKEAVVEAALLASKSLNPQTQDDVAKLIQILGADAYEPLVAALDQEDPLIRARAVRFLGDMPNGSAKVLARLVGEEQDFVVLYELPLALGKLDAPETIPALAAMLALRDDQTFVVGSGQTRAEAVEQLRIKLLKHPAYIADTLPMLLLRLGDDNSYVVQRAHTALVALGSASVPATLELADSGWRTMPMSIVAELTQERERARRTALFAEAVSVLVDLREPTTMNDAQRTALLRILDDALANEDLRSVAATALQNMGGYALPTLIRRLDSDDLRIRVTAAQSLKAIGDARAAKPLITRIRNEREAEALVAMIGAIEAMRLREAIPVLVEVLESSRGGKDPRIQGAVVNALARVYDATTYPDEMARATKLILNLATSRKVREGVRNSAVVALGKIKPDGVALSLRRLLLDEKEPDTLRRNAAWALGELGSKSLDAVPAMEEILKIRREEQKDFLKRLKQLYGNEDVLNETWAKLGWVAGYRNFREVKVIPSLVRSEIVIAYYKIKGAEAVPLLVDVLQDDQRAAVREAAAWCLGELKKEPSALIKALKDDKVGAVRAKAAEALGKIKSEEVIDPLLKAIREDEYETTGRNAIIGLREAKYDKAVRGLVSILRGDHLGKDETLSPSFFSEISYALVKDGSMVADAVMELLNDDDEKVRAEGAYILGAVGATTATDALIAQLESDENPHVREQIAMALGRLRQVRATKALLSRFEDAEEWYRVRNAAAWALGSIRALDAREPLLEALNSPYPALRATAATALGNLEYGAAEKALVRLARDRAEPEAVRTAAIAALGKLGGDVAKNALLELLGREAGAARIAVVSAIGAAKVPEAVPALLAALENRGETEDLRRAAASALGSIGDPRAAIPLTERLIDPTEFRVGFVGLDEHYLFWETVSGAARNFSLPARLLPVLEDRTWDTWYSIHFRRQMPHPIGAIQDPRASEVLLKILDEHTDTYVRQNAIRSMGLTGNLDLVPKLISLLTEAKTVEERRAVAQALGDLGDPRAIAPLTEALASDADEAVRNNAATALGKLGVVDALAAQLGKEETAVGTRITILNALHDLGPKAKSALSAVEKMRNDSHGGVVFAAHRAIAAITGTELGGA